MLVGGMRLPPNVMPLVGPARLAARGVHPILEAPDNHTLVQYAGLKGIPGSGPGVSGYAEEDETNTCDECDVACEECTVGDDPDSCTSCNFGYF